MKRTALRRRKRPRPKAKKPKRDPDVVWHGPGGENDSHREFVRSRGCLLSLTECFGPVETHHVTTQRNGGTFRDLVPLCQGHHTGAPNGDRNFQAFPVHDGRETFVKQYRIDLTHQAALLLAHHYPEGLPDER